MKLSKIFKKKQMKLLYLNDYLKEEKYLLWDFHTHHEIFSKLFVNKIEHYTNGKVELIIVWSTRKIQSLHNYKNKVQDHSWVKYHGVCSCGADYISKTIRNSKIRWKEHSTGKDRSCCCVKHLTDNLNPVFDAEFLMVRLNIV